MAIAYQKAELEDINMLNEIITNDYPELREHQVRIGFLIAYGPVDASGMNKPVIKKDGHAQAARIKLVSKKDRLLKEVDVEIIVDGNIWDSLGKRERMAILDHELYHLEFALDKEREIKYDDEGRVKLKMRPHDMVFSGFSHIAEKYGPMSQEVQTFRHLETDFGEALNG